jgi:hypothetical protein
VRASSELVTPNRRLRSATSSSDLPRYKRFSASTRIKEAHRIRSPPPHSCFMPPARTAHALAPATPRSLLAFALSGSALVSHRLPHARAALAFMSPCFNATRTVFASVRLKPSASLLRSAHAHCPHLCTSTASPTPVSRLLPALWLRLCNLLPHAPPFSLPARSPGHTPLGPSRALLHAWATKLRALRSHVFSQLPLWLLRLRAHMPGATCRELPHHPLARCVHARPA